jgi:tetratricopeptide (TPR) repeat protein
LLKKEGRQAESITYLEKLDQIASFDENRRFAKLNLMQAYYASNEFEKTLETANFVLEIQSLDSTLQWDALILKARSALMLSDSLVAATAYEKLERVSRKDYASEALFFRAERLFLTKDFKTSISVIEKIAGGNGQSNLWNAKALLLLAKNYYALDDSFQAIFVLESIIENFIIYPEITEEAKNLLVTYRNSAAEENRSITQKDNEN